MSKLSEMSHESRIMNTFLFPFACKPCLEEREKSYDCIMY